MSGTHLPQNPPRIVIATGNNHKISEIRTILFGIQGELLDLRQFPRFEEPEENAPDYVGNALLKARYYAHLTELPSLADDSGLEVDELDGRPGLLSARYGGAELSSRGKIEKLLEDIRQIPRARRSARFRCAVALVWPDGQLCSADATCEGTLLEAPDATPGAFGYDPIFVPTGFTQTFSQLPPETKHRVSHRGKALRKLFNLT